MENHVRRGRADENGTGENKSHIFAKMPCKNAALFVDIGGRKWYNGHRKPLPRVAGEKNMELCSQERKRNEYE